MALRSLRLSLRFVLPLVLALGLFAFAVMPLVDMLALHWFVSDLDTRSQLLANALHEPLLEYVSSDERSKISQLFDRAIRDERLYAIGFCGAGDTMLYKTATFPASLHCRMQLPKNHILPGNLHVAETPVESESQVMGKLILVHDMSFIDHRIVDTKKYVLSLFALLTVMVSSITVFIAHLSRRGWINAAKEILRSGLRTRTRAKNGFEIQPLVGDLRAILRESVVERRVLGTRLCYGRQKSCARCCAKNWPATRFWWYPIASRIFMCILLPA